MITPGGVQVCGSFGGVLGLRFVLHSVSNYKAGAHSSIPGRAPGQSLLAAVWFGRHCCNVGVQCSSHECRGLFSVVWHRPALFFRLNSVSASGVSNATFCHLGGGSRAGLWVGPALPEGYSAPSRWHCSTEAHCRCSHMLRGGASCRLPWRRGVFLTVRQLRL